MAWGLCISRLVDFKMHKTFQVKKFLISIKSVLENESFNFMHSILSHLNMQGLKKKISSKRKPYQIKVFLQLKVQLGQTLYSSEIRHKHKVVPPHRHKIAPFIFSLWTVAVYSGGGSVKDGAKTSSASQLTSTPQRITDVMTWHPQLLQIYLLLLNS